MPVGWGSEPITFGAAGQSADWLVASKVISLSILTN